MSTFNDVSGDDPIEGPSPVLHTGPVSHEEVVESNLIRLDPRDLHSIIQAVKTEAPSSSQSDSSSSFSFKREGFGRQFDFNLSLIRKLSNVRDTEDCFAVNSEVAQLLTVRNATLKIADSHPGVFQFLDDKAKSESLKTTDPGLSEFMESIKKTEREESRKRKPSSVSMPFRKRETTWRPVSVERRAPVSFSSSWGRPYDGRRSFDFPGREYPSFPPRGPRDYRESYKEMQNRRKSSCNLCGREGHWVKDCPQNK
ncbi:hypothetical protein Q1695_013152 [Nippostrongylus brasiliensis]|nr:hypothetical protein Q1695_013152 [Nippostrongylus brasiliensis]